MALECELKYLGVNLTDLSHRLEKLGGECQGRYFESNHVFDYSDRSLKRQGILLRLREKQGQAVLTVKRPPQNVEESTLKVFEEIETVVGDSGVMQSALKTIGFHVAFSYEKVREKWRFAQCVVCLDKLPFGDFVEIEGREDTVAECARHLELEANQTSKATYHALNIEYRRKEGLSQDESFVFLPAQKRKLMQEIKEE